MSSQSTPADRCLARLREAAALLLWQHEAIRVRPDEPFRLASGNRSPIYVNCRRLVSEPVFLGLFTAAARLLLERSGALPDVVAGGETAGIPFATVLASALGRPLVYVRKKTKGYGLASRVEGHLESGEGVLLVEDLITDGGSKLGFLDALAEAGGEVTDALVVFDREQGGAEALSERGVRLHAVTGRAAALAAGEEVGLLDAEARRSVEAYFADPEAWHRERGFPFVAA